MKLYEITIDDGTYDAHGIPGEVTYLKVCADDEDAKSKAKKLLPKYNENASFSIEELEQVDGYKINLVKQESNERKEFWEKQFKSLEKNMQHKVRN